MPLMRYFLFVGGVLLALLFVVNAALPTLPVSVRTDDAVDLPVIRIQSDRKWPERVVFDTRVPASVPAAPTVTTQARVAVPATDSGLSAKARVLDAFAQLHPAELQPVEPRQVESSGPSKPEPKPRVKRKIAKAVRPPPPPMMPPPIQVAQQPRFGFFGNNTW